MMTLPLPPATQPAGIRPELLVLLVCPVDKAELRVDGETLVCTVCKRRYPVENGIPNMLVDTAN